MLMGFSSATVVTRTLPCYVNTHMVCRLEGPTIAVRAVTVNASPHVPRYPTRLAAILMCAASNTPCSCDDCAASCGISECCKETAWWEGFDSSYPYLLMVHYIPSCIQASWRSEQMQPETSRVQRDCGLLSTTVNESCYCVLVVRL
jgi:hypothetical protein